MKDCREITKRLSAFMDGELTDEEEFKVRQHLKICAKCQRELREMRQVSDLMNRMDETEPSPYFWNNFYIKLLTPGKPVSAWIKESIYLMRDTVEGLFIRRLQPAAVHTCSLDVFNDFPPESFGQLFYSLSGMGQGRGSR